MTDFLEQVVARRREYVTQAKRARPVEQLLADLPHNAWTRTHIPSIRGRVAMGGVANAFDHAIRVARQRGKLAVIAEVKRVSPALGRLAAASLDVAGQALQYTA